VIAWLSYATVALWFLAPLPWMLLPRDEFVPVNPVFLLISTVVFVLAGGALGAVLGLTVSIAMPGLLRRSAAQSGAVCRAVATGSVIAVTGVNALINRTPTDPIVYLFVVYPVLLIAVIAAILGSRRRIWLDLSSPWRASLIVVSAPWIAGSMASDRSLASTVALGAVPVVLVVLGSAALPRFDMSLSRRTVLAFVLVALTFLVSFQLHQGPRVLPSRVAASARSGAPTIILIVLDTVRADHLSLYGYDRETTPNLQHFSLGATVYRNASSSGDMTLPSHGSLFTGLYPSRHGAYLTDDYPVTSDPDKEALAQIVNMVANPLADEFDTMAEILQGCGYRTFGIISNYGILHPDFGLAQGFDYFDYRVPEDRETSPRSYFVHSALHGIYKRLVYSSAPPRQTRSAEEITDAILERLPDAQSSENPFFLFVNYMDAHWPYLPPPPYDNLFPGKQEIFSDEDYGSVYDNVVYGGRELPAPARSHLVSQYDGAIAYLDNSLARLFDNLKDAGLYDSSMIIVTSDHGEAFGERNVIGHAVSVHQDQISVPLIIKYPGQTTGSVVNSPANGVDLLPTVLDVVGHTTDAKVQGRSLAEFEEKTGSVFSESFPWYLTLRAKRFDSLQRAVTSTRFKLIRSDNGERELYDLKADPLETTNVYELHRDIAADLEERLNTAFLDTPQKRRPKQSPSPEALERLRSLGYIQ